MLRVGDIHDDKRQFRPPQHAETDHHGILPVEIAGVARRGGGRDHLGKKHGAQQDKGFIKNGSKYYRVKHEFRSQVDEKYRANPGKGDVIDNLARVPVQDVPVFTAAETKILLPDDQSRHVGAYGRVQPQLMGEQADRYGNQ